eukprot:7021411-Pyramimonas_sp.AAC.1
MPSIQSKLWHRAAEHWCGDGVQNGVDNASHRRLISQLKLVSQGERLSERMVSIAVGVCGPGLELILDLTPASTTSVHGARSILKRRFIAPGVVKIMLALRRMSNLR